METVDDDDDHLNSITRSKRDADSYDYMITPTRTRCPLLLVADYRFFREMGGGDTKTTINYLVSINIWSISTNLTRLIDDFLPYKKNWLPFYIMYIYTESANR